MRLASVADLKPVPPDGHGEPQTRLPLRHYATSTSICFFSAFSATILKLRT